MDFNSGEDSGGIAPSLHSGVAVYTAGGADGLSTSPQQAASWDGGEAVYTVDKAYDDEDDGSNVSHARSAPILDYLEGERDDASYFGSINAGGGGSVKDGEGGSVGDEFDNDSVYKPPQESKYWFLEIFGILGEPDTFMLFWLILRMVLFGALVVLPFALYDLHLIQYIWWSPIMGIIACAIPSGGAPVAGGIVFLPIITAVSIVSPYKIPAVDAVCYSAATQMIGVGILVPLTWWATDRSVFDYKVIAFSMIPCCVSMILILAFGQFHGVVGNLVTIIIFGLFCLAVGLITLWGLIKGTLVRQNEDVKWDWKTILILLLTNLFGGVLVAYIGIGVEKILFIALTSWSKMNVRKAGLSSITVVGLASFLSYGYRWYSEPHCIEKITPLWVFGLSGIVLGCTIGPWLNKKLGPRNVMIVFVIFLLAEALRAAINVILYFALGKLY